MLKNKILSIVRRLSGAERNFHKMIELEQQIEKLSSTLLLTQQKKETTEAILVEKIEKRILEEIEHSKWQNNRNYDAIKDVLYSMISLASINSKTALFLPEGTQHIYEVEKDTNGRIHFQSAGGNNKPPVFIVTLPKSGTYFLGKILEELGFANINIHAGPEAFHDYKGHSHKESMDLFLNFSVSLPYRIQINLVKNGQYLLGHLPALCEPLLKNKHLICTIRDLRHVFVSGLRFSQRRAIYKDKPWFSLGYTEEALFSFMNDSEADWFIYSGHQMAEWYKSRNEAFVRFEGIINENHPLFYESMEKIGVATGFSVSEILAARKRALCKDTLTYSGSLSLLENVWSDRIEKRFKELGGDLINEALGYLPERERERERERESKIMIAA